MSDNEPWPTLRGIFQTSIPGVMIYSGEQNINCTAAHQSLARSINTIPRNLNVASDDCWGNDPRIKPNPADIEYI